MSEFILNRTQLGLGAWDKALENGGAFTSVLSRPMTQMRKSLTHDDYEG